VAKEHLVINRRDDRLDETTRLGRRLQRDTDSYTIFTRLQRGPSVRAELAKLELKVPEHKVRVVAPDIGGSFGMKSAIYNEVPLVLLASEEARAGRWKMDEHALGGVPVRRMARDNVTDAELALDRDGTFSRLPRFVFRHAAPICIRLPGLYRQPRHAGRVYRTPAMYVESTAGVHPHPAGRPYRGNGGPKRPNVIERMVDRRAKATRHRSGRAAAENYIPADAMPFKTSLTFHLRLRRV